MSIIAIESETLRVGILPELGAGMTDLSMRTRGDAWVPLMRPTPVGPTWFNSLACYHLAPWSNRISQAWFRYGGRERTLRPDWPDGSAIHGDAKARPWRLLDRSPNSARFAYHSRESKDTNWPWRYGTQVRYELRGQSVRIELTLRNEGSQPFPAGLGFHPFWQRRVLGEEAVITLRTKGRYPADQMIPTGPAVRDALSEGLCAGQTLGNVELDEIFAGFDGNARIAWGPVHVDYECSPDLGHAVIYAYAADGQPGDFFCLEPVTMLNDGFKLKGKGWPGTGVRDLAPGTEWRVWWNITVTPAL